MLEKLKGYLDQADTDLWYDDGCFIARNLIDENPEETLMEIISEWKSWPVERQEHLAYILGESNSKNEIKLINEMLKSQSRDVVFRAKEAFNELEPKT